DDGGGDDTTEETADAGDEATDDGGDEATDDGGAADDSGDAPDLSGTSVSVFGAPTSIEADAMNEVIQEYFNDVTGANAVYEGSDSFEEQVQIRVEGGNPPDVALYPQPGAVIAQA